MAALPRHHGVFRRRPGEHAGPRDRHSRHCSLQGRPLAGVDRTRPALYLSEAILPEFRRFRGFSSRFQAVVAARAASDP
jgi:hypothetical protein